jgi:hypothetical protein
MGLVQGDGMARASSTGWAPALLDRTICASAGGEALTATYGGRSACMWSTSPRAG